MSVRTGNGSAQWLAGEIPEHTVNLAISLLMTNGTQAEELAGGTATAAIQKIDLAGMTQVRLVGRVATVSASVNTPKIMLKYKTGSFSTTVGNYSTIGTSAVEGSVFTGATYIDTGWINLAEAAKVNDVFIAVTSSGGDGAADPEVRNVTAYFR